MNAGSSIDFWFDSEAYQDYIISDVQSKNCFSIDLIRLSSIRKMISNFIRILTKKTIAVYFCEAGSTSRNVNGKTIYISSNINTKDDFHVAVGLALHEAAHTVKTDFDIVVNMWTNLPKDILKQSDLKNIYRPSIERFLHYIWNIVEDRYIDDFVYNRSPGYRGYYEALYNRYWNSVNIDLALISDNYRYPSLESYLFRICNFTNDNTDLSALPRLDEIADILDLTNISRLTTTKKRIEVAFDITRVVLDCIDKEHLASSQKTKPNTQLLNPDSFFGGGSEEGESEDETEDMGTKMIKEMIGIADKNNDSGSISGENKAAVGKISNDDSPDVQKHHTTILKPQIQFLRGTIPKTPVTATQKELLNLIDQHGICLVNVGKDLLPDNNMAINCIVVKKMTKELILKGAGVFPLSSRISMGDGDPEPDESIHSAVLKGIQIGKKLGRKLQIRNEDIVTKNIRKKSGQLNRRLLHEAGFDSDEIFYNIKVDSYNKATLHITVDASTSMSGEKWLKTMTSVVAICKATSSIDNIHVTVSFRCTQSDKVEELPYVILAYDSKVDKFSKIKNLFPYLSPGGCTPEGLAFEAIMEIFKNITPDEEDRFLLNLSDGEPFYHLHTDAGTISYSGDIGVSHTKHQVNKIRNKGVQVMSYFIEDGERVADNQLSRTRFKQMYGPHSKYINVENITDLAITINKLFLEKRVGK